MTKTALLGTTVLVVLSVGGAAAAAPSHPALTAKVHQPRHVYVLPHRNSTVLYDQSQGSNGVGVVSQNFEPTFSVYFDANGADDFPSLGSAKITEVVANGMYFNGSGPADSFDVILYKKIKIKNGKEKAKIAATCSDQSYTDLTGSGYADITLNGCDGRTDRFDKGGWLAVIANMAFQKGGEWGWNTNNVVNKKPSVWRNPGDGFSLGCTNYYTTTNCVPDGEGGDFAFALLGP